MEPDHQEIREMLAKFQQGYVARDTGQLDELLHLFVAKDDGQWRFAQKTFSLPTIYPPDVRLTE